MQQRDYDQIKSDVVGRWPGLFAELGIDVGDGKHGPCPVCGGKDRFRMDNLDGKGTWFCNQCGNGDGWALLQGVLSCDFNGAVDQVAQLVGRVRPGQCAPEKGISPEVLRAMFVGSVPAESGNLVGMYLKFRGLTLTPPKLRYHPGIRESETCTDMPAMLGVVTMPDGKAATMHRTYLDKLGRKARIAKPKKLMPLAKGKDTITGGAIRLFDPVDGVVGVAEGIETAIACMELFRVPTWSVISASGMAGFVPPPGIKTVCVYGDNDESYTGQKAAYTLANRLVVQDKLTAEVQIPDHIGDWLDELNRLRAASFTDTPGG